jgi:hypothetical protein
MDEAETEGYPATGAGSLSGVSSDAPDNTLMLTQSAERTISTSLMFVGDLDYQQNYIKPRGAICRNSPQHEIPRA